MDSTWAKDGEEKRWEMNTTALWIWEKENIVVEIEMEELVKQFCR